MTTFASPASTLDAKAPDASKHVNFTLGMLLGVDDFNQEHAYLIGRDRWLARDAIGYGTLCGLLVSNEITSRGPRVTVTSGTALTPKGQLVCVKPAQCAYINDWIAANKAQMPALLGSPAASSISLYLSLCYRDCPVDLVPIPGEPCRSEDELMAPSRLVDDFSLELRSTPPDQAEENALRDFVQWLRMLAFGGGGPYATVGQFEAALRSAVRCVTSPPSSPPGSPISSPLGSPGVSFNFGSPLMSLRLDPALSTDYYRSAFRIWIEEIRPCIHAICAGACSCCKKHDTGGPACDECLLLARLDIPIVALSANEWRVDDTRTVTIDESRRPMLVHLRLLQELVITGGAGGSLGAGIGAPRVVAAGLVGVNASAAPTFGNLTVAFQAQNTIRINFDGYNQSNLYVVKALSNTGIDNPTIAYDSAIANGILLRVTRGAANVADVTLRAAQFMIEVSQVQ
jgi:hypothetical protein